ncbi:MAG: hypothetical protein A3F43_05240 [Gammaproteobacteria bacterium RIFCSPHIGHO2_12_FULL_42_10]|nr:MAG: hypothetical protein A3F43_05240 [Gammaproteobacteria bacterium RIFCSPHIGHO2_12_FULL_42_10]
MAVSQRTRAMTYLHDKTIATMVGQQILNEIEVNLLAIPSDSVAMQKTTYMLGQTWYAHISTSNTQDLHIQKIIVCIFSHLPMTKHSPTACVKGYRNNDA